VDEAVDAAQVGDQAEAHLEHGESHVLGAHPQVASQGKLEPRADGVPLDGGDRRLVHLSEGQEGPLGGADERPESRAASAGQLPE
jgi:hypothetical protein